MAQKKAEYAKPNSQLDLEARQESGNTSSRVVSTSDSYREAADDGNARDMTVEDNDLSEYVGVDVIYQNYAVDTDKPLASEKGAEKQLFDEFLENVDPKPELPPESDEDDEDYEPTTGGTSNAIIPAAKNSPEQGTEKVSENKEAEGASNKAADKAKGK